MHTLQLAFLLWLGLLMVFVLYLILKYLGFSASGTTSSGKLLEKDSNRTRSNSFENITACGVSIEQLVAGDSFGIVPHSSGTYAEGKSLIALAVFQALHSQLLTYTPYYLENRAKVEQFSALCTSAFQSSKSVGVVDNVWQKLALLAQHGGRLAFVFKQNAARKNGNQQEKSSCCYIECLLKDKEEPGDEHSLKILSYTTGCVNFCENKESFTIEGGTFATYTLRYKDGTLMLKVESGEDSGMYTVNTKVKCQGFITEYSCDKQ